MGLLRRALANLSLVVLRTLMQLAPRNVRGVLPNGAYYRTNSGP